MRRNMTGVLLLALMLILVTGCVYNPKVPCFEAVILVSELTGERVQPLGRRNMGEIVAVEIELEAGDVEMRMMGNADICVLLQQGCTVIPTDGTYALYIRGKDATARIYVSVLDDGK